MSKIYHYEHDAEENTLKLYSQYDQSISMTLDNVDADMAELFDTHIKLFENAAYMAAVSNMRNNLSNIGEST